MFSQHTFTLLSHFNLVGPGTIYSKALSGGTSISPTAL